MKAVALAPRREDACLSDLALDQLAVGELVEPERSAAERHLVGCSRCQSRRNEMDGVLVAPLVWESPRRARPKWHVRASFVVAGALVATLAVLVLRPDPELTRFKGAGASFSGVIRRANGRLESFSPGMTVAPGDAIRFIAGSPKPRYVLILGVDGSGKVSLYEPDVHGAPRPIAPGPAKPLEASIVFDDAPGPERIHAFFCERPLAASVAFTSLEDAVRRHGNGVSPTGVLGPSCSAETLVIGKRLP